MTNYDSKFIRQNIHLVLVNSKQQWSLHGNHLIRHSKNWYSIVLYMHAYCRGTTLLKQLWQAQQKYEKFAFIDSVWHGRCVTTLDEFLKWYFFRLLIHGWCVDEDRSAIYFVHHQCGYIILFHDGVIKCKHFPCYWPFVRGIHRAPVNSLHKGQWRGALMFLWSVPEINGWVNNREAGDLRRHRGHYEVAVMS